MSDGDVAVTVTPGRTAPCASVTTPTRLLDWICANADVPASDRASASPRRSNRMMPPDKSVPKRRDTPYERGGLRRALRDQRLERRVVLHRVEHRIAGGEVAPARMPRDRFLQRGHGGGSIARLRITLRQPVHQLIVVRIERDGFFLRGDGVGEFSFAREAPRELGL